MKRRAAYLLLIIFLLQTAFGLLFRQMEATEYIRLLVTQGAALFLPSVVYLLLYRMPAANAQGRGLTGINVLLSVVLMVCTGILSQLLNAPIAQLLAGYDGLSAAQPQMPRTNFEFLLSVLFLCVIPAIIEELLFRGIVLREYVPVYGAKRAIVLSAAIYTIFHFDLSACMPQFFIGLVTAILVYRTGSLAMGMVAHFTNNFLSLMIQLHTEWFAEALTVHMALVLLCACCLLIIAWLGVWFYNPRRGTV